MQANTTATDQKCADWSLYTPPSELLILSAGLHSNVCRNPDWDDNGPWCFDSRGTKKLCGVPKCGGSFANVTSVVATFEDMEAGVVHLDGSFNRLAEGSKAYVDTSTSYCGRASMFYPNTFGDLRSDWFRDRSSGKTAPDGAMFTTSDTPHICMAYKIPPTSTVTIEILFVNDGNRRVLEVWKRFGLNIISPNVAVTAMFNVIAGEDMFILAFVRTREFFCVYVTE